MLQSALPPSSVVDLMGPLGDPSLSISVYPPLPVVFLPADKAQSALPHSPSTSTLILPASRSCIYRRITDVYSSPFIPILLASLFDLSSLDATSSVAPDHSSTCLSIHAPPPACIQILLLLQLLLVHWHRLNKTAWASYSCECWARLPVLFNAHKHAFALWT